MSHIVFGIVAFFSVTAVAKPAIGASGAATAVASDGVDQPQLRVVGRLNVNTATRDQLQKVPALEAATVEAILEARLDAPIADLDAIPALTAEARSHLKVEGDSNFTRILQNPLKTFDTLATRR